MKNNLYGLTNLQMYMTQSLDDLNKFLLEHNGEIIDIQCSDDYFHVLYHI